MDTITIPDELKCPITLELMNDPVLCEDGYTYERTAIMNIPNSLSPMTRQPIDKSKLIPNRALKSAIERFISSNSQVQNHLLEKQKYDKQIRYEEQCKRSERSRLEAIQLERVEISKAIRWKRVDTNWERVKISEADHLRIKHEKQSINNLKLEISRLEETHKQAKKQSIDNLNRLRELNVPQKEIQKIKDLYKLREIKYSLKEDSLKKNF